MSTKSLFVISDTHVGLGSAVFPPDFKIHLARPDEDVTANLSVGQAYLYECWEYQLDRLPKVIDVFLINGDALQGHRPPWATKMTAPNLEDQRDAALELFKPIARRARNVLVTKGTSYHSLEVGDYEYQLAKALGAKYSDHFDFKLAGKTINACHGHSAFLMYRSQFLERESHASRLAFSSEQVPLSDLIIRSHGHFFTVYTSDKVTALMTPCWQLPTEYHAVRAASYYKTQETLGSILLEVTDEEMPDGVRVIRAPFRFAPPKQWTSVLNLDK